MVPQLVTKLPKLSLPLIFETKPAQRENIKLAILHRFENECLEQIKRKNFEVTISNGNHRIEWIFNINLMNEPQNIEMLKC